MMLVGGGDSISILLFIIRDPYNRSCSDLTTTGNTDKYNFTYQKWSHDTYFLLPRAKKKKMSSAYNYKENFSSLHLSQYQIVNQNFAGSY